MSLLTSEEINERLPSLNGWSHDGDAIVKTFKFESFPAAMEFMSMVAVEAERLNHHPDWSNVYNKVEVRLTSHDAGGVTSHDFDLAEVMDKHAN